MRLIESRRCVTFFRLNLTGYESGKDTGGTMISHVMEPVLSGTYTVLASDQPGESPLYAATVPKGSVTSPGARKSVKLLKGKRVKVVEKNGDCMTVDLPPLPRGVVAFSDQPSFRPDQAFWLANRPRLDWSYPQAPQAGDALRLLGRLCVNPGCYRTQDPAQPVSAGGFVKGVSRVAMRRMGATQWIPVKVETATGYEIRATVPRGLKPGRYEVCAHNGWGGGWGWSDPLSIDVSAKNAWPKTRFRVDDYLEGAPTGHPAFDIYGNYDIVPGTDETRPDMNCFNNFGSNGERTADAAIQQALDAARKNGGGIVEFGGRIYDITKTIVVPPKVVLRGQGQKRTWIRTPLGNGPRGPYVVITGDDDFAVEDLRIVSYYAVVSIAAPVCVPATFEEAADTPWHKFAPKKVRNVAVRRCYIHQRLSEAWPRRLAKNCSEAEKQWIERINHFYQTAPDCKDTHLYFSALRIRAGGVEILDNTIYAAQTTVTLHGCSSVRIAGNRLMTGSGGNSLIMCGWREWPADEKSSPIRNSYLREILIEDNLLASQSDRSRNGTFFYQSGYHGYAARNRIVDCSRASDGEGIGNHLWMERWEKAQVRMTGPVTAEIIDPEGQLKGQDLVEAVVEITGGRGAGQLRMIVERKGNLIQFEKPWRIDPDESSICSFTAPPPFHKQVYVDNHIENTGASIILWGSSNDVVLDGNTTVYGPGIGVWSCNLTDHWTNISGGAVYTQVINNTVDVGMLQPDDQAILRHYAESLPQHGVISNMAYLPTRDYDFMGLLIRGNCTRNNSGIVLKKTFIVRDRVVESHCAGMVCENNFAENSEVGIILEKQLPAAVRGNRSKGVKRPIVRFDYQAKTVETD